MTIEDSIELITGVPLIVIIPALVELAKNHGLPVRYAGGLAIALATVLLVLGDLAISGVPAASELTMQAAQWMISGLVVGLAAAGFYSQQAHLSQGGHEEPPPPEAGATP